MVLNRTGLFSGLSYTRWVHQCNLKRIWCCDEQKKNEWVVLDAFHSSAGFILVEKCTCCELWQGVCQVHGPLHPLFCYVFYSDLLHFFMRKKRICTQPLEGEHFTAGVWNTLSNLSLVAAKRLAATSCLFLPHLLLWFLKAASSSCFPILSWLKESSLDS